MERSVQRVTYVWDADYPWDVRTEKICRALTDAGISVEILARNVAWAPLTEVMPEGTVRRMRPWRFLGRGTDRLLSFPAFLNPRWIAHLIHGIRAHRPDVVIVRDLPLSPTALWVSRWYGVPVLVDLAENYPAMIRDVWDAGRAGPWDWLLRNPRLIDAVERYTLPRVDQVIVVVEESADRVAALGVDAGRISIVSNTPSRERVAEPRSARPADRPLLLTYLGLMEVPRGIEDVLEAFAQLVAEGRSVELQLIGEGRDRALFERRAADLGLREPQVRFLGALPNAEALRLVAAADVGLVPHHAVESWNTTIPNKLFDYMAAGLPVDTSDAIPAARVVRTFGCGLVYRSRDPVALAAQLRRLFDSTERSTMGEAGRRAVLDRCNWEHDAEVLLRVIRSSVSPQHVLRSV